MNPDNGHLIDINHDPFKKEKAMIEEGVNSIYKELPADLQNAAKLKLNGRHEAHVSLSSGGKLSKWAALERKKKNKVSRLARRKNRK
jgi:hypothetical protein